jgi:orotate phosphoribosyltransferase-like protein
MMIVIRKENSTAYDEVTHEIAISSVIVQVLPLRYNLRQGTKERKATRMHKFQIRWRSVIRSSVRLQGDFRALQ